MYSTRLLSWYKSMLNVNWILPFILGYFGLKWYINSTKFTNIIKEKEKKYKATRGVFTLWQNPKSRFPLTPKTLDPRCSPSHPEPQTLTCAIERERGRGGGGGDSGKEEAGDAVVQESNLKSRNPNPVPAWALRLRERELLRSRTDSWRATRW